MYKLGSYFGDSSVSSETAVSPVLWICDVFFRCLLRLFAYVVMALCLAGFLELINNMLTSGMVPALFPDDEKEGIIGQVVYLFILGANPKASICA
jgi:membrane-bound metal-dependent hydrolase YbcI (DUF457 family)